MITVPATSQGGGRRLPDVEPRVRLRQRAFTTEGRPKVRMAEKESNFKGKSIPPGLNQRAPLGNAGNTGNLSRS